MYIFVNEKKHIIDCDLSMRLIDYLRIELKLTGTKEGCSEGECGACTILVDDLVVPSCLVLLGSVISKRITTIEGIKVNGEYDRIQLALVNNGAVQCGFCTPGMVMSIKGLYLKNSNPSLEDIKKNLSGNLCRCTGYTNIIKAAQSLKD